MRYQYQICESKTTLNLGRFYFYQLITDAYLQGHHNLASKYHALLLVKKACFLPYGKLM
jgi:hypothetical protein